MRAIDYNRIAREYHRNRRAHLPILEDLISGAGIGKHSRVLEIGCGTGNYISAMADATGCRCWGIDPSAEMLCYARLVSKGNVTLEQRAAERMDVPDVAFDLIFSVDVIHHVADRPAYFSRARRQLSEGGCICTVTDSEQIIRARQPLSKYFPETVAVELRRYPEINRLREELYRAGFGAVWETATETPYQVTDLTPFSEKAYSSLHLISREAHERGLARMQEDLDKGPIRGLAQYCHLWAKA